MTTIAAAVPVSSRAIAAALSDLVDFGERGFVKQTPDDGLLVALDRLSSFLTEQSRRPIAEGARVRAEALLLIEALRQVDRERRIGLESRITKWTIVVGVLLPMVRDNYSEAALAALAANAGG